MSPLNIFLALPDSKVWNAFPAQQYLACFWSAQNLREPAELSASAILSKVVFFTHVHKTHLGKRSGMFMWEDFHPAKRHLGSASVRSRLPGKPACPFEQTTNFEWKPGVR